MNRVKRLLQVLQAIVIASLLLGLLDYWFFVADLASQFRLINGYLAIAIASLLVLFQSWYWAVSGFVVGVSFLFSIWSFACPVDLNLKKDSDEVGYSLVSFNVLLSNKNKSQVTDELISSDPDFIFLFEINPDWDKHLQTELAGKWPYFKIQPRQDAFGVALFSKRPFKEVKELEFGGALTTPAILAHVELDNGKSIFLVGIHPVPPVSAAHLAARNRLFNDIADELKTVDKKRTLVAGDFNCAPWVSSIRVLVNEAGLRFAEYHQGIQMTWSPFSRIKVGLPIDHVLVGQNIKVLDYGLGGFFGSDHRLVRVRFQ